MLIDAHTHLDRYVYKKFGRDINPVLAQIEEHRILTLSSSMDLASYKTICKIAKNNRYVVPAFGIHPWNAHKYLSKTLLIQKMIDKTNIAVSYTHLTLPTKRIV